MKENRIRLYLIHGTWPRGFFRTGRIWSDPGEETYKLLQTKLPAHTELEAFNWSGRNSMAARKQAAIDLEKHLRLSLDQHPSDCHIVLAHSHGGTVATQAVSSNDLDGKIHGIICLATPFAYLVLPSFGRLQTGILALTSVLYALYWTALLAYFPWIPDLLGVLPFAGIVAVKSLIAFLLILVIAKSLYERHSTTLRQSSPQKTPIFLLRGSRDEASMLLTEAQFLDSVCATIARLYEVTQVKIRQPLTLMGYLTFYTLFCAVGVFLATHLAPVLTPRVGRDAVGIVGFFVYSPAIAGCVYLLGYGAIALAAGHWSFRQWLTSGVEIEAAPPNTTCKMYVFSDLDTSGLRHGLYEDERVLEKAVEFILSSSILEKLAITKDLPR